MEKYTDIYNTWLEEQTAKAKKVFTNPFTNVIEDEDMVTFRHKLYIGGSTDATIMGVNPYRSAKDEYESIVNLTTNDDRFAYRRGHALEPFVANEFSLIKRKKIKEGRTFWGDDFGSTWSMAQVDFLCDFDDQTDTPIEIKVCSVNPNEDDGSKGFGKGCQFNELGEEIYVDDTIPTYYMIQCQKQLWLTKRDYMYLACWLTYENKIRVYKITRNDDIIAKIKEAEIDFLFNHVIPQVPYVEEKRELETVEESPCSCYATCDFIELVKELREVNKNKLELSKRADALNDAIREYLGVHDEAVDKDGRLVIKQTKQTRLTLDTTALKNDHADLCAQYMKEQEIKSKLTINNKYFN